MKKIPTVILTFALILFGGGVQTGITEIEQEEKQASMARMQQLAEISFNDQNDLEYAEGSWNALDLVNYYHWCKLTIDTPEVDLSQVGRQLISYTISASDDYGQTYSQRLVRVVDVVDTAFPEIRFTASAATVDRGAAFDARQYIESVSDPVDGELIISGTLVPGSYTVTSDVDTAVVGNYTVTVQAEDVNGNLSEASLPVSVTVNYAASYDGSVLSASRGAIYGPSGRETYYNLDMSGVVAIMRRLGNNDPYWVRSDGVKMLGDYVMVAANLELRPRGSYVQTSLGMGIVCDTGGFAARDPYQLDIATAW